MKRCFLIGLCLVLVALVGGTAARAAAPPRPLLVGFEDEPSFLWSSDRLGRVAGASEAGANVIRVIANWSTLAPSRPGSPANPADPAYQFNGLDDLVWQAQQRGMRVLLTVWGTPSWASSTHKPNAAPAPATLGSFCSALASRYSGHFRGQPPVTLFSVWNEPNLNQFLAPQYDARGRDVAPRLYAAMVRSCYSAIKRANPKAVVAAGDTSPRGTDHARRGIQASHSPGRFAQLVAAQRPRVRFDAWAHHPYGVGFTGRATVPFRWPNVGVADLPSLETHLKRWFRLRSVPLWITEFAYQTSPERIGALSYAGQASYLNDAFLRAAAVPQVQMFIWFVFRDTPDQRWQSGLYRADSTPKPALATWKQIIAPYSVDNPTLVVAARSNPTVPLGLVVLQAHRLPSDPPLGVTYRVYDSAGALVIGNQTRVTLDAAGTASIPLTFSPTAGGRYRVELVVNDIHGTAVYRTATLVSS